MKFPKAFIDDLMTTTSQLIRINNSDNIEDLASRITGYLKTRSKLEKDWCPPHELDSEETFENLPEGEHIGTVNSVKLDPEFSNPIPICNAEELHLTLLNDNDAIMWQGTIEWCDYARSPQTGALMVIHLLDKLNPRESESSN